MSDAAVNGAAIVQGTICALVDLCKQTGKADVHLLRAVRVCYEALYREIVRIEVDARHREWVEHEHEQTMRGFEKLEIELTR